MRSSSIRQNRSLYLLALLWALFLLAARAAEGGIPFPPVPEAMDLAWDRQPLSRVVSEWNMESPEFPWVATAAEIREAETASADPASALFRDALKHHHSGGNPEETARRFLRAYAAARKRNTGYVALKEAARFFFRAGDFMETSGVLEKLIERSGGGKAGDAFYLFKGEALARQGNHLTARECFRRAAQAKWNPETARKIALRIADMSFLMGNIAYAEPAYRKALNTRYASRRFPFESVRFGETLLSAGKTDEAAAVFRNVRAEALSADARAMAFLGEGDALLLRKDLPGARAAYEHAEIAGSDSARWWALLRKGDVDFAAGNREEAWKRYASLKECRVPDIGREAWYKAVLARYLQGDHESVLRESQGYLARFAGKRDESLMRRMTARSGGALVAEAGRRNSPQRWPMWSEYLFAYGRTPEGKELYAAIGREWEAALLWGGASALYAAGGDFARSRTLQRVEEAERRYWQGDLAGAKALLFPSGPAADASPPELYLLAKIRFREGKHGEAGSALERIQAINGGSGGAAPEREAELLAFTRAMEGRWGESLSALQRVDPEKSPPHVKGLRALAARRTAPAGNAPPPVEKGKTPPAPNDLYSMYERIQERYRRLSAEGTD